MASNDVTPALGPNGVDDYQKLNVDSSGNTKVRISASDVSLGGGTQYTEGDVVAAPVGNAILWKDAGNTLKTVNASDPLPISAASLPLPTGASTLAEQLSQTALLTSIDVDTSALSSVDFATQTTLAALNAKLNSLGQKTMAGSAPVVIASDQSVIPVNGDIAEDAAISGTNPILVGGESPTGTLRPLQTAPDGDLVIHHHSGANAFADGVSNTLRIPVNESDLGFLAFPVFPFLYNGTTWDRLRGDATNGLLVNLGANNDVTVTGTVAATQSGTWVLGANSGVDIGDVTINNSTGVSAVNIQDGGNSITVDNAALSVVGGGTEATALRVTIANNSTGVLSVDDNGSSLTVDGTVAVSSITTSVTPGTAAANLGKARDLNWGASDTGVGSLFFRNDYSSGAFTNTALTDTQGDYTPPSVEATGRVHAKTIYETGITSLSSLNTTFNNTTTTANSGDVTGGTGYSWGWFSFALTSANTPTDITFVLQEKKGANYYDCPEGPWGSHIYDDTVCASQIRRCVKFRVPGSGTYRIVATATGTDATNTFTLAECAVTYRTIM